MSKLIDRTLSVMVVAASAVVLYNSYSDKRKAQSEALPSIRQGKVTDEQVKGFGLARTVEGDSSAPLRFFVFSDYECPFCQTFHEDLLQQMAKNPRLASVSLIHFPLPSHRFAKLAAQAAECAADRGVMKEFSRLLFAKQDSIGLIEWGEFAYRSGIADSADFKTCLPTKKQVVESHLQLARNLDVDATPTIVVDGTLHRGAISPERLDSIFRKFDRGR